MSTPIVPSYITVHLGAPDEAAPNVRVPFIDYIKNVASSEICPTSGRPSSRMKGSIGRCGLPSASSRFENRFVK